MQLQQFPNSSSMVKIMQDESFCKHLYNWKRGKGNISKFTSAVHRVSKWNPKFYHQPGKQNLKAKISFPERVTKIQPQCSTKLSIRHLLIVRHEPLLTEVLLRLLNNFLVEAHEKAGTMERRLPQAIRMDIIYKNYSSFNTVSVSSCMYKPVCIYVCMYAIAVLYCKWTLTTAPIKDLTKA